MLQAVRTVSEDDRWHVIEGLAVPFGGPFNGRDTYSTRFTPETDFGLATRTDLGIPIPIWYHHGLDPDFGFDSIGVTTSIRAEDDGLWVQAQLDKRHRYYETRVKPLLEASSVGLVGGKVAPVRGGVGLSAGSAEHSQVIAARTGEVKAYPIHEISLTPTESNPYAVVAIRSGDDSTERLVIAYRATNDKGEAVGPPEGGKARADIPAEDFAGPDKSFPIVTPASVADAAASLGRAKGDRDAIKAKIISIAKRKGAKFVAQLPKAWTEGDSAARTAAFRAWCQAAADASRGAFILQQVLDLIGQESDEPDQLAVLQGVADGMTQWIGMERAEIEAPDADDLAEQLSDIMDLANAASQTAADLAVPAMAVASYIEPAIRAGKRNSAADQERINSIGQHAAAISEHVQALSPTDSQPADDSSDDEGDDDAAARSADAAAQPAVLIAVRTDADPYAELKRVAEAAGRDRALELLQRR